MTPRPRHPIQRGIETALVIPVALAGRVRSHLPAVVRHLENSRVVGRLAVDHGIAKASTLAAERLPGSCDAAESPADRPQPAGPTPAEPTTDADEATAGVPDSPSAIADYASLAASQVVPRLSALSPDELAEVGAYESATRRRRTILSAVERLSS